MVESSEPVFTCRFDTLAEVRVERDASAGHGSGVLFMKCRRISFIEQSTHVGLSIIAPYPQQYIHAVDKTLVDYKPGDHLFIGAMIHILRTIESSVAIQGIIIGTPKNSTTPP
jgi:hypothetical protein